MKNYRRAQAALEFLTTYGWAFLVILVMIGALAYFGVLSPNRFLPERCTFQQEVTCKDFRALRSGNGAIISFYLTNNLGNGIEEVDFTAVHAQDTSNQLVQCLPRGNLNTAVPPIDFASQRAVNFTCDGSAGTVFGSVPAKGTKTKFIINGTYKEMGGYYNRSIAGELFVTVQ